LVVAIDVAVDASGVIDVLQPGIDNLESSLLVLFAVVIGYMILILRTWWLCYFRDSGRSWRRGWEFPQPFRVP